VGSLRSRVGIVVIGRNEGERLRRCLGSIPTAAIATIYVDSGSRDESVEIARETGVRVVELSPGRPFTAARARNEGCERLLASWPEIEFVQFIDGDCELDPGWLTAAVERFDRPEVAIAFGRLRERDRDRSIYNRLCDIEWWQPPGDAEACGGIALVRIRPFRDVGGFASELIAGEEPDLCVRLRERGWRIVSVDAPMAIHDADMLYLGQWWRRAVRSGHAYAEVTWRHRGGPSAFWQRNVASNWAWGAGLPLLALLAAPYTRGWGLLALGGWIALALRIFATSNRRDLDWRDRALYSAACALGKTPAAWGQTRFYLGLWTGRRSALIEHKR